VPFLGWLQARVVERHSPQGAQVSWARFEKDEPALAAPQPAACTMSAARRSLANVTGVRFPYGDSRGAKRSPWSVTRDRVSWAVKKRSWGWRQASTSAQVTGVETVGNWRARSE